MGWGGGTGPKRESFQMGYEKDTGTIFLPYPSSSLITLCIMSGEALLPKPAREAAAMAVFLFA